LKDPSADELDVAIEKLRLKYDLRPVLICYIGHGIDVDGKINCPLVEESEPEKRQLYPIEQKLYDLKDIRGRRMKIGVFFNCSRIIKKSDTPSKVTFLTTDQVLDRKVTFAYSAHKGQNYRSISSTQIFIRHMEV
jgi:hypothetical protein